MGAWRQMGCVETECVWGGGVGERNGREGLAKEKGSWDRKVTLGSVSLHCI